MILTRTLSYCINSNSNSSPNPDRRTQSRAVAGRHIDEYVDEMQRRGHMTAAEAQKARDQLGPKSSSRPT